MGEEASPGGRKKRIGVSSIPLRERERTMIKHIHFKKREEEGGGGGGIIHIPKPPEVRGRWRERESGIILSSFSAGVSFASTKAAFFEHERNRMREL